MDKHIKDSSTCHTRRQWCVCMCMSICVSATLHSVSFGVEHYRNYHVDITVLAL